MPSDFSASLKSCLHCVTDEFLETESTLPASPSFQLAGECFAEKGGQGTAILIRQALIADGPG